MVITEMPLVNYDHKIGTKNTNCKVHFTPIIYSQEHIAIILKINIKICQ